MFQKILLFLFCLLPFVTQGQDKPIAFFTPADSLHKKRFWAGTIATSATYAAVSIGLYNTWYKQFELTKFHTFNDVGEWKGIDKTGHFITTYAYSQFFYKGARWTGIDKKKAIWTSIGISMLLQTSLEVMDGFSKKWGFSWSDTAVNLLGTGFFAAQTYWWDEIKFKPKFSSPPLSYPNINLISTDGTAMTTLQNRVNNLYGTNYAELLLKDYNALTIWLSFNPNLFLKNDKKIFPSWLNLSLGYGAENLFGGYKNEWTNADGATFVLPTSTFSPYRQYYLSLDIDLTKIKTRYPLLKTLLSTFNFIKIPAPTLEINSLGKVKFHPFWW